MKSRVHPKYKTKYRVTNWPEYEESLVKRGDITVWMSPEAIAAAMQAGLVSRRLTFRDVFLSLCPDREDVSWGTRALPRPEQSGGRFARIEGRVHRDQAA